MPPCFAWINLSASYRTLVRCHVSQDAFPEASRLGWMPTKLEAFTLPRAPCPLFCPRRCFVSCWFEKSARIILVLVAQSCPTLCNPMNCTPPGFSVHGILQARILDWLAISYSKASFRLRDQTRSSALTRGFFTTVSPLKLHKELHKVSNVYYTK